jgi:head-tail adaptor
MRRGALRHTATIYDYSSTPDAFGAIDHTYVADPVTHKCLMKQRTFRERLENNQEIQRIEFELHFNYSEELELLNPGAQLEVNGRRLEVLASSDPDGKRKKVVIFAESLR